MQGVSPGLSRGDGRLSALTGTRMSPIPPHVRLSEHKALFAMGSQSPGGDGIRTAARPGRALRHTMR
jgi:hypothetical protein